MRAFSPLTHARVRAMSTALGACGLAFAALLAAPTAARAANASDLSVALDTKPGAGSVSVSRDGLSSYASYKIKFTNSSTNTVNQVVLTATTSVTPDAQGHAGPATYSVFVNLPATAPSPNCTAPPTTGTVTCQIGQLKSNDTREFFLIYLVPASGATLTFTGNVTFSEGNSPNAPPASYTKKVTSDLQLITAQPDGYNVNVVTVLPPIGGSFFTGANAKTSAANVLTSSVAVPSSSYVTDNNILQGSAASYACSAGTFTFGLTSAIDIRNAADGSKVYFPGTTDPLITIVLRQDAASLTTHKPVPAVGTVPICYRPNDLVTPTVVPACASDPTLPHVDQPCVSRRSDFFKGNKGYYEYEIKARDNGRFDL